MTYDHRVWFKRNPTLSRRLRKALDKLARIKREIQGNASNATSLQNNDENMNETGNVETIHNNKPTNGTLNVLDSNKSTGNQSVLRQWNYLNEVTKLIPPKEKTKLYGTGATRKSTKLGNDDGDECPSLASDASSECSRALRAKQDAQNVSDDPRSSTVSLAKNQKPNGGNNKNVDDPIGIEANDKTNQMSNADIVTGREGTTKEPINNLDVKNPKETSEPQLRAIESNNSTKAPGVPSGRRVTKMEGPYDDDFEVESYDKDMPIARSGRTEREKTEGRRTVKLTRENEEFYADRKWPDGVVRYVITDNPNYDTGRVRRRLATASALLEGATCARLRELRAPAAGDAEDYLVLDADVPDYVPGMVGGRQPFGSRELFEGGQPRQHTALMVMTMLGFYFESSRHDRDQYIHVNTRNIRADKLHHFDKMEAGATLPLPYDYASAAHPAARYWKEPDRGHSLATYKRLDPTGEIMRMLGENEKLFSDIDFVKINSVYGTKCLSQNGQSGPDE